MADADARLPGKLGNPSATLETDPRLDPRIAPVLEAFGAAVAVDPVAPDASYEECLDYCRRAEEAGAAAHPAMLEAMPPAEGVERTTEVIEGADGNEITLYIHQPAHRDGPLPAIVHTHGGGMVMMTATDPIYLRWRNTLAETGLVVVGVEFRNGGGRLGDHPFPAGLEDCAAAARWTFANKSRLGISSLVVSGESGGGNLSLATALKANHEGWIDEIDGVFAMCPYISGAYADPPGELLSLTENDGYMLDCRLMGSLVKVYDPTGDHYSNPLAWPLQAQPGDLAGLPPHLISVNELDPLRDEGLAYYRKLAATGVSVAGRTVNGTPHGGDIGMPDVVPEIYAETVRAIHGFASALAPR